MYHVRAYDENLSQSQQRRPGLSLPSVLTSQTPLATSPSLAAQETPKSFSTCDHKGPTTHYASPSPSLTSSLFPQFSDGTNRTVSSGGATSFACAVQNASAALFNPPPVRMTYENVRDLKMMGGFWYDTVDPHYSTHNDVAYPLELDAPSAAIAVACHERAASKANWSDVSIPQWSGNGKIRLVEADRVCPHCVGTQAPERGETAPFVTLQKTTSRALPAMEERMHAAFLPENTMPETLECFGATESNEASVLSSSLLSIRASEDTSAATPGKSAPSPVQDTSDSQKILPGFDRRNTQPFYSESADTSVLSDTQVGGGDAAASPVESWRLEDFDVVEQLSVEGDQKCFLAVEKKSGLAVVLKCISKEAVMHQERMQALRHEITMHHRATRLSPYILQLYGFFWDNLHIFLVSEWAEGGSLLQYLHTRGESMLTEEMEVACVARELLLAVLALHSQGIAHRNINPACIFLHPEGLKLTDFSCATALDSAEPLVCGGRGQRSRSPWEYWAPEVMRGDFGLMKADMWSIGIVVYELLCGCRPLDHVSPHDAQRLIASGRVGELPNTLSSAAWSFLHSLLVGEESARMDAETALVHPFITREDMGHGKYSILTYSDSEEEAYVPPAPPIVVTPESFTNSPTLASGFTAPRTQSSGVPARSDSAVPLSTRSTTLPPQDSGRSARQESPFQLSPQPEDETAGREAGRSESENTLPDLSGTVRPSYHPHMRARTATPSHSMEQEKPHGHRGTSVDVDDIISLSSDSMEDEGETSQDPYRFPSTLNVSTEDASDDDEVNSVFLSSQYLHNDRNASPEPHIRQVSEDSVAEGKPYGSSMHRSSSTEETSHGPTISFPRSSTGSTSFGGGSSGLNGEGGQRSLFPNINDASGSLPTKRAQIEAQLSSFYRPMVKPDGISPLSTGGRLRGTPQKDSSASHSRAQNALRVRTEMKSYDPPQHELLDSISRTNRKLLFNESDSEEELGQWVMNRTPQLRTTPSSHSSSRSQRAISADDQDFYVHRQGASEMVHGHTVSGSTSFSGEVSPSSGSATIIVSPPTALEVCDGYEVVEVEEEVSASSEEPTLNDEVD